MKKRLLTVVLSFLFVMGLTAAPQQKVITYTLDNGLTVYLWQDPSAENVHGRVITRAGAVDEPQAFTGLAHYLEHMMFKGTDQIGSMDWSKEKPLYDQVVKLYDLYAATPASNKVRRDSLTQVINTISIQEAKLARTDDIANLTESFGGSNLNAFTSYDLTAFVSDFPAYNMEKWLKLNSDRFINPVFRSFQAELENVFEEYNMYQDDINTKQREFTMQHLYKGTPYDHDVIGYVENLRNPSLTPVINFYNQWYVAPNMCLALSGNFELDEAKTLVAKYFNQLPKRATPTRNHYNDDAFEGGKTFKAKIGYSPMNYFVYTGPKQSNEDVLTLQIALQLFNNSSQTGVFDKMMLDGDISGAYAVLDSRREAGRLMFVGIPYYDVAQNRFDSSSATRKAMFDVIDKIKAGDYPDWMLDVIKASLIQSETLVTEDASSMVNQITDAFVYEKDINKELYQADVIKAITKADITAILNKYTQGECMTIAFEPGTPDKTKLEKPSIEPLVPSDEKTPYTVAFNKIPMGISKEVFNNFDDVKNVELYPNVNMHYSPNTKNDFFSVVLRYGVGTSALPKLKYATQLLNTAGVMPSTDAQSLRRQFAELGGSCSFSVDDSYFYIQLMGNEKNLKEICTLMTRQALMPKLDNKQIGAVVGNEINSRRIEQGNSGVVASAVLQYMLYGDKSPYIDRFALDDLYKASYTDGTYTVNYLLTNTDLTTTIQSATNYALDIYFCGKSDLATAVDVMKSSTPMSQSMMPSNSPVYTPKKEYKKTQVYFLADKTMQQGKLYLFFNGKTYNMDDAIKYAAFNQYFSGGFSGVVMNEIREKRSLAYTAYGQMATAEKNGQPSFFIGYVGSQSDKLYTALETFSSILDSMPVHKDRIPTIKTYLHNSVLANKPGMRSKAMVFQDWKEKGYTDDPAKKYLPEIEKISFETIQKFFEENVQNHQMTILIMGDPKLVDLKAIQAKYGKINKIKASKVFK